MEEDFLDELEMLNDGFVDVCPSCGAILSKNGELGESCNDPMGCGSYLEYEEEEFEDGDDEYKELDFG